MQTRSFSRRLHQERHGTASGVKRDSRTAELPDEDGGGKFLQVEGLMTVDAGEIPCEFSVEDDFDFDQTTPCVDEETVRAILAGKDKELDAIKAFGILDLCGEIPTSAKIISERRQIEMSVRRQRIQT